MARDIEEFLRRAAERRQQKQGGGAPQRKPPAAPPPQAPRQQAPQRPLVIDDVEIVESRSVRRPIESKIKSSPRPSSIRTGSVADHVRSHIDTSDLGEHASHLGERITSVHDQVESRIHDRLDHDLTAIDDTPTVTDDPSPAIFGAASGDKAMAVRQLLSNPTSVAQAIVMAEILKRPNFND